MKMNHRIAPYRLYTEGEGAGSGAGAASTGSTASGDPPKTFTQEQVDDLIKKRLGRDKTEREDMVKKLEKLQTSEKLTAQEKEELQGQIDTLNASFRTAKEQSDHEKKQLETKLKSETEALSKDRDTWKGRFHDSTTKRSITDAAVTAGGEYPEQFVLMFSSSTRLEEEKGEDGKVTGAFIPKLKFQGVDGEGKVINFDLPPTQAFAKMKELGMHKNLFKHGANAGTGAGEGSGKGGGTGEQPGKMPDRANYKSDDAFSQAYQSWRSTHNMDGSPRAKA